MSTTGVLELVWNFPLSLFFALFVPFTLGISLHRTTMRLVPEGKWNKND